MKKRWFKLAIVLLSLLLVLSACGSKKSDSDNTKGSSSTGKSDKKGGTLNIGTGAPPEGNFSGIFASSVTDSGVIGLFSDGLFKMDDHLQLEPNLVSWKEIEPAKKYKFTLKKGVKWQDGNPLTINDWIFTLETLANPDYDGPRYDNVDCIEGAQAKKEGQADTISGIKKIDDYNVEITFKEKKVNNLLKIYAGDLLSEKIFKDIPVKDMAKSDAVRKHPIGYGPFKVKKIVDGESVQFEKNKDYWKGEPKLDKINYKVVDQNAMVKALQNGDIDMVGQGTPPMAKQVKDSKADNIKVLTAPSTQYMIIGFVLNKYDKKAMKVGEPLPKYQDVRLRKAMDYAINKDEWIKAFMYGYAKPTNSLIPTSHWVSQGNKGLEDYSYNVKKAKKLLDEAGYKDRDGDGFREDPKGKKFEISLKHYAGTNPTFEPRTAALKGYWEKVGLKTKVSMVEFSKYNADLEKSDGSVEVYFRGWQQGADPDPSGLYKSNALWNESRYNNPESDKLLAEATDFDVVGNDKEKRKDIYLKWQKLWNKDVPVIPLVELEDITLVSNKVKNFEVSFKGSNPANEWTVEK